MPQKKTVERFIEQANDVHNKRYGYLKAKYISSHIKVIITCDIHKDFVQTPANHLEGQGCPKCMAVEKFDNVRFTNEEMDEHLINNKIYIKRNENYINSCTKISWICLKCNNEWRCSPNSIRQGSGCPKCNDTRLNNKYIDEFIINNKLFLIRIDEYINSYIKINWKCLKCNNIWLAASGEIIRKDREGSGCPQCARGKNEKRVAEALDELNIEYKKIRINLECKKLFPDYYLPKHNIIIEYNGIQHYKPTCFGSMSLENANTVFIKQQLRDNLLRNYCLENKINLLEIDGRKYKGQVLKKYVRDYFEKENKLC